MYRSAYVQAGGLTMKKRKEDVVREERVSMNIALSPEDKKYLKVYAAEHDTTVASVIAELVDRLRKGNEK